MCNYLDGGVNRLSIFETLMEHQEKCHGKIDAGMIHIFPSSLPYPAWLIIKRKVDRQLSQDFWQAWRTHKNPAYVTNRLKALQRRESVS